MKEKKAQQMTLDVLNAAMKVMAGHSYDDVIDILSNVLLSFINFVAEEKKQNFETIAYKVLDEMKEVVDNEVQATHDFHPVAQA